MPDGHAPVVGIVMGSDSDWPKIKGVAAALEEFGVAYEARVMSAHRTPEVVREYAGSAAARGLKVLIAAAGGAAHLAGVVAAHTTLPVIGIPVPTELMGGLDSLNSESLDLLSRLWNGTVSMQGAVGSGLALSILLGAVFVCCSIFLAIDRAAWQPNPGRPSMQGGRALSASGIHL